MLKPRRLTSARVVAAIKRAGAFGRVGHAGTLDPLAEGVLPIAVGGATRMIDFLHRQPKRYLAVVMFGVATDTQDLEGRLIARCRRVPGAAALSSVLSEMVGRQSQRPPAYSAVRVDGRRAYDLARAGRAPELPEREVQIHSLNVRDVGWWRGDDLSAAGLSHLLDDGGNGGRLVVAIDVACSSGTYIRSLARDLGERLCTLACLAGLVRTAVGPFAVDGAIPLDDAVHAIERGHHGAIAYPPDEAALTLPGTVLGADRHRRFVNGNPVACTTVAADIRVYGGDGAFLGIGSVPAGELLRPRVVMAGQAAGAS